MLKGRRLILFRLQSHPPDRTARCPWRWTRLPPTLGRGWWLPPGAPLAPSASEQILYLWEREGDGKMKRGVAQGGWGGWLHITWLVQKKKTANRGDFYNCNNRFLRAVTQQRVTPSSAWRQMETFTRRITWSLTCTDRLRTVSKVWQDQRDPVWVSLEFLFPGRKTLGLKRFYCSSTRRPAVWIIYWSQGENHIQYFNGVVLNFEVFDQD